MTLTDTDPFPIPSCMYTGKSMANVPAGYLIFLYKCGLPDGSLLGYINDNMETLEKNKDYEDQTWKDDHREKMRLKKLKETEL